LNRLRQPSTGCMDSISQATFRRDLGWEANASDKPNYWNGDKAF
jgi:hypothetical protein